jgi:hypothetical protein
VLHSETHINAFRDFVADNEARLRQDCQQRSGLKWGAKLRLMLWVMRGASWKTIIAGDKVGRQVEL